MNDFEAIVVIVLVALVLKPILKGIFGWFGESDYRRDRQSATSISQMYSPGTHTKVTILFPWFSLSDSIISIKGKWVGSQFKRPQQDSTLKGMTFNQYRQKKADRSVQFPSAFDCMAESLSWLSPLTECISCLSHAMLTKDKESLYGKLQLLELVGVGRSCFKQNYGIRKL